MTVLYLAWRDPGRQWYPIGRLIQDDGRYQFEYTRGALRAQLAGFSTLPSLPSLHATYVSDKLFLPFSGRIPSEKRPDFQDFLRWLSIPSDLRDPFAILARSSGKRETDTFELFPVPEMHSDGTFEIRCFIHGLRHQTEAAQARALELTPGDKLTIEHEADNPHHELAIRTLCHPGSVKIGFLPRYLADDLHTIGLSNVRAVVEKVNPPPVPIQFRVLCRLTGPWPSGCAWYSSEDYEPVGSTKEVVVQKSP